MSGARVVAQCPNDYASGVLYQTGGSGGFGLAGATGGAGASSRLVNAATGVGNYLRLYQHATGGAGGASGSSTAGIGGAGASNLSITTTGLEGRDSAPREWEAAAVTRDGLGANPTLPGRRERGARARQTAI